MGVTFHIENPLKETLVAHLGSIQEGVIVGTWAKSVTDASVSIQADRTSASLMLYVNEEGNDLPFAISVQHSVDKDQKVGIIQIPTLDGEHGVRHFSFDDLIEAFDNVAEVEKLKSRLDELERRLEAASPA